MLKNQPGQKWRVFAFDADGNPVTGEAANITATLRKDHAAAQPTDDTNPTEEAAGYYDFDITQAECNADDMAITPQCSTPGVLMVGDPPSLTTIVRPATGAGARVVNLTVRDQVAALVSGARVTIQNAAGSALEVTATTNASGVATVNLDDGNYKALVGPVPGFETHTAEAFTVDEDNEAVALTATRAASSTPTAPGLCALDAYVYQNGSPIQGATVTARIVDTNSATDGVLLSTSKTTDTTDATGKATLQLVRLDQFTDGTGTYEIEAFDGSRKIWSLQTTIPNQASANLEDLTP